jgi:hypothetical protein
MRLAAPGRNSPADPPGPISPLLAAICRSKSAPMRLVKILIFLLILGSGGPARAEVEIAFYSKDFASTFPHAFVRLTGIDEATGQPFDTNYGFTPVRLAPGILFGPVQGMIHSADPLYVSRSDRHFSLTLDDEQYRAVVAVIEHWRDMPQPSYRLNSRNCVHFVAEVATVLGLHAPPARGLMKKPKSFLQKVTADNSSLIAQWPVRTGGALQNVGQ